jgi:hypothetical protein
MPSCSEVTQERLAEILSREVDLVVIWPEEANQDSVWPMLLVRASVASGVPVLTRNSEVCNDDYDDAVFRSSELFHGVSRLLKDESLRGYVIEKAELFCRDHSWSRVATLLDAFWRQLMLREKPLTA